MILSLMTCKIWGAKIEHGVLWFGNLEKLGFFFMIMELKQVINVSYKKCHMKCYLLIFDFTKMGQLSTT